MPSSRRIELQTPLLAAEESGNTANSGLDILRADEDEDIDGLGIKHIEYYRWCAWLWALSVLGTIVTAGTLQLAFRWMPVFALKCRHRRCVPHNATHALITSTDTTVSVVPIHPAEELRPGVDLPRSLVYRHVRYFEAKAHFQPVVFECRQSYPALLQAAGKGLGEDEVVYREALFGKNLADVPVKSHIALLLDEVLHPFYIFQVWSVVVWYLEPYILYATAIALISIFSALVSLFSTRRNLLKIKEMAAVECDVKVLRQNRGGRVEVQRISSIDLVPGDVVEIEDQMLFPCDIVLCAGSVVVNESMLTGESLPVLKTSLPLHTQSVYDPEADKRFTLWAGTKSLEARPFGKTKVTGIVLRTGFATAKGRLVRSILFPKPSNIKFYADSFKFVAVMSVMAVAGFLWSVQAFIKFNVELRDIILNACDIVTIAVPPALPAAMTIGTEFALERLKKAMIFCISPSRVNIAGQLDTLCFDKTGTLTEDGVDVMGVLPADETAIQPLCEASQAPQRLLECLAACHSLTSVGGELIGDPLDLKMFHATGWSLHEPAVVEDDEDVVAPPMVFPPGITMGSEEEGMPDEGLAIVRRFDFTSNHQRMSVIVRTANERGSHVLLKGAPEVVRDLCDADSVPPDFSKVVQGYTRQGLRLLACAHKYEKSWRWDVAHKATREKAECNLKFLGILILENRLKKETTAVIEELKRAQINCCMVTGDHVLTGVTVSRRCGLIHPTRTVFMAELTSTSHGHHPAQHGHERRQRRESNLSSQDDSALSDTSSVVRGAGRGRSMSDANLLEIEDMLTLEEEDDEVGDMEMYGVQELPQDYRLTEENLRLGLRHNDRGSELSLPSPRTSIASSSHVGGTVLSRSIAEEKTLEFSMLDDHDTGPLRVSLETMLEKIEAGEEMELALTGAAFEHLHTMKKQGDAEPMYKIMEQAKVYARMSPEQKQALVELFAEEHQRIVGMCGDGANDCGALKAAHVGLSLSDAEASIAAPFTSSIPNISPLLQLMREGRAALVTSISCFKFMALYSAIQFITVLRLYRINTNMSDFQYLWIDLFIIFPLAVYMARTGPYHKLSVARPHGRLISFPVLASVLGQTAIAAAYQFFAAWWTLQMKAFHCQPACPPAGGVCDPTQASSDSLSFAAHDDGDSMMVTMMGAFNAFNSVNGSSGFGVTEGMPACCASQPLGCPTRPIVSDTDDNIMSVEATSAFLFSQFQYLAVVIAFNTSKPFRRNLVTNYYFFYSFLLLAIASSFLLLAPDNTLVVINSYISTLEVQRFPVAAFKTRLFALAIVNSAVTYAFECIVEVLARQQERASLSLSSATAAVIAVLCGLLGLTLGPVALLPFLRHT